jgi:curli biogenesis system outer membrane secretion channel CsgG
MGLARRLIAAMTVGASLAAGLTGCVTTPLATPPVVQPRAEITLPPPPQRALTVGVYSCIDTSGQRRPTGLPQELSTAAPMDCTPYVMEAVRSLRPGYVFLVERQHVDELLRERQLATLALNTASAAPANETATAEVPPPAARHLATLRVAEILLIGQVVSYDRSTKEITGGAAVGGYGGNAAYVTDLVTFSLRAVAVQTGEVLGQTTVTKSITSIKVGGHIAKIFPTTALDAEIGGDANEPVGIALGAAVRSALVQLVSQGIHDGWWA